MSPKTHLVRRAPAAVRTLGADIAVLGAGIAGISAALAAASLGRRVVLIDAAPALGGQSVGAMVGTFCGLFANGPSPRQVTHGIADRILADLGAAGALHYLHRRRNTTIVQYKVTALARWIEEAVRGTSVVPLLGAVLSAVERDGRRLKALRLATRYGELEVKAAGFVDASGDAALAWSAGLAVREPVEPIYGTLMFTLEGVERAALTDLRDALSQLPPDSTAERIQEVVYEVGRRPPFLDTTGKIKTRDGKPGVSLEWFNMLYQVLLGQEKGPRFGSFVALYGLGNTIEMIDGALARSA